MQWQVKIINTRTGGVMFCGVTGVSRTDAFRNLSYVPGAGHLVIASIVAIPPRDER